jgi:2'-5' RNA ligase
VSDGRARLFVALDLPGAVQDALGVWVTRLPRAVRQGVRPVAAEALHVTLCFLGWQPEQEIEPIAAACRVVAAEPEVDLAVLGPVWLPRRRPRVLAVGLEDRDGALERLQGSLSAALAAGSWYQPEKRPYMAHVTVARVSAGSRRPGEAGRGIDRAELTAPPSLTFPGSRVVLYRSRLHRSGARYEALAAVALRANTV